MTTTNPALSIVIPAYNEEVRITPTLNHIVETLTPSSLSYEIVLVDDGSSDQTIVTVEEFSSSHHPITLVTLASNQGKGSAVRHGIFKAQGDAILIYDADGSTPIEEVFSLLPELTEQYPIVIGSRALPSESTTIKALSYRKLIGRVFNGIASTILSLSIADTQCGFKLFTRPVARYLFSVQRANRFSFDIEILYIARRSHINVKEVPVNWHHVPGSKVNVLTDSIQMFICIFKHWLAHRKRTPEDFARYVSDSSDESSISRMCTSS